MSKSKASTVFSKKALISLSCTTQQQFSTKYKKINGRNLYLQVLTHVKEAVKEDNVEDFQSLCNLAHAISKVEEETTLKDFYENSDNPVKHSNLAILACKHGSVKILQLLLCGSNNILESFFFSRGRRVQHDDEDECGHNAYYYALRSGNLDLLNVVTSESSSLGRNLETEELDDLLATAYEELKVGNVLMPKEAQIFVEDKLISLRFFNKEVNKLKSKKVSIKDVLERINIVLENIQRLSNDYFDKQEDETFTLTAKFIAQNIYILKRQIKSTYSILPWEEIEFCVIIFIFAQQKVDPMNFLYRAFINKAKLLKYLNIFAEQLNLLSNKLIEQDIQRPYPSKDRGDIVRKIIATVPEFEALYNDYEQVRDMYSLKQIEEYIDVAVETTDNDPSLELLVLERTLQIIGENTKNTLMSPRLSDGINNFIFLSFPENVRKMIKDLRNSLSHSHSHFKRIEVQNSKDSNFLKKLKNDLKKIRKFIIEILYKKKIKISDELVLQVSKVKDLEEVKKLNELFAYSDLALNAAGNEPSHIMEHNTLKELLAELKAKVNDNTEMKRLFDQINSLLTSDISNLQESKMNYEMGFVKLKSLLEVYDHQTENYVKGLHFTANSILNSSKTMDEKRKENIANLIMYFTHTARSQMKGADSLDLEYLISQIMYLVDISFNRVASIKLFQQNLMMDKKKQQPSSLISKRKTSNELLEEKLSILRTMMKNLELKSVPEISRFVKSTNNKRRIIALEMLVLDILSILGESKNPSRLSADSLCLDGHSITFIGRELRNHLAHGNALANILGFDINVAVTCNALNLINKELVGNNKVVGKEVASDLVLLKERFKRKLRIINDKEKLFEAIRNGDLEEMKSLEKQAVDIFCRDKNGFTALHFASKGSNVEVLEYLFNQGLVIDAKNRFKQNPIHLASFGDCTNIISYLVFHKSVDVNCKDYFKQTPLHRAASNASNNAVQFLLNHNADYNIADRNQHKPIHSSIQNHHLSTVKLLLKKEKNVDSNQVLGGYTPLHFASEIGAAEIADFLIQNKANVNSKNYMDWTPLHAASFKGYATIAESLISHKASVNAAVKTGCIPLYYALENGHEDIAKMLLDHGSKVNISDYTFRYTPLQYAAKFGCEEITEELLKKGAIVDARNVDGLTALHYAALGSSQKIIERLIKYKADVNARDNNGVTPLHYAAGNNRSEMVTLLLKHGAFINCTDNEGNTPMFAAVNNGHADIVKLLLGRGVNINAKYVDGDTLLHIAAARPSSDIVNLLLKNNASIDARNAKDMTPLHVAIVQGRIEVIEALLAAGADVNAKASHQFSTLHFAAQLSNVTVVQMLITAGANVDYKATGVTPLLFHIMGYNCNKDVMEILIKESKNISIHDKETLLIAAIKNNYKNIVQLLIDKEDNVTKWWTNDDPFSVAVVSGFVDIVKLLFQKFGNAVKDKGMLMIVAVQLGYADIVEILLENGCDPNAPVGDTSHLFVASHAGHIDVIQILISNGVDVNAPVEDGRLPIHIAVSQGHNDVVEMLINNNADFNATDVSGFTALHVAAQTGDLGLIKYLTENGADIHALNEHGSKPIHIAAREGRESAVEYFISKGISVMDRGCRFHTLLHYAGYFDKVNLARYLVTKGSDVNAEDIYNETPLHVAAQNGSGNVLKFLINHGAIYNTMDRNGKTPLDVAKQNVAKSLRSTTTLFELVKQNRFQDVSKLVKEGAFVNAKDADGKSPLHYAVINGFHKTVKALLEHEANPNLTNESEWTPLHYASKLSFVEIAKTLLLYGAIFDVKSTTGKMPLDFTSNKILINLLKLLSKCFLSVQNGNSEIINDLEKIQDADTINTIMRARNKENRTLIVVAMLNDFPNVEKLKKIAIDEESTSRITYANALMIFEKYDEALTISKEVFEERKVTLGATNPSTLEVQFQTGIILYKMAKYQEALDVLEATYSKQKGVLGEENDDVLETQEAIALTLHRKGKDLESLKMYERIYKKQKEIFGETYEKTVGTKLHMGLVFHALGHFEKALKANREVYQYFKETYGRHHHVALTALTNIGMVLESLEDLEGALEAYREAYDLRIQTLGLHHSDTLRTMQRMVSALIGRHKYDEALDYLHRVHEIQEKYLGSDHHDTLHTQLLMGDILFKQGQHVRSLEIYKKNFEKAKAMLGADHPYVISIMIKMQISGTIYGSLLSSENSFLPNFSDRNLSDKVDKDILRTQTLTSQLFLYIQNNSWESIEDCINVGARINAKDEQGLTPLHYAVYNGNKKIVEILLEHGADATETSKKGNTPLHFAVNKEKQEIVKILLEHRQVKEFINLETALEGSTALHVAAKNGFYDIVKILLSYGAIYNKADYSNEGKTSLNYSKSQNVTNLFVLLDKLFEFAVKGNSELIARLNEVEKDTFLAVTSACNIQEQKLLEILIKNKHVDIARELVKMLQIKKD